MSMPVILYKYDHIQLTEYAPIRFFFSTFLSVFVKISFKEKNNNKHHNY